VASSVSSARTVTTSSCMSPPTLPAGNDQHRLHIGTLLRAEPGEHPVDLLLRQVLHELGEVLRLHLGAEREQLRLVEQLDERRAHRRRELEQDGAAAVALDEPPRRDALVLAQALEHERGVGRVAGC